MRARAHHLLLPSAVGCRVREEIFNAWSRASAFLGPDVICSLYVRLLLLIVLNSRCVAQEAFTGR